MNIMLENRVSSMLNFLIKRCIKNSEDVNNNEVREAYGKFAGIIGIISNLTLFALKITLGILSGAISIIADAINNLTDMGSSVITILGFKLAGKKPDKEHPFGHERIEYITGLIISIIVIVIGIELGRSSIDKIINPTPTVFSTVLIILLVAAIAIKLWQGLFYRSLGKKINSVALSATSQDSFNDCIATTVVLIGVLITRFTGFDVDGYFGIAVSIFIIISGLKLVKETTDPLIGIAPDPDLVLGIKNSILSYDGIYGIHDMVCHMYGQSTLFVTVHCEVSSKADIIKSHELIDLIERDINEKYGAVITIHLDPIEVDNPILDEIKENVSKCIKDIDDSLLFHDFRAVFGEQQINLIFDVVVPYGFKYSNDELLKLITKKVKELNDKYNLVITFDNDYVS